MAENEKPKPPPKPKPVDPRTLPLPYTAFAKEFKALLAARQTDAALQLRSRRSTKPELADDRNLIQKDVEVARHVLGFWKDVEQCFGELKLGDTLRIGTAKPEFLATRTAPSMLKPARRSIEKPLREMTAANLVDLAEAAVGKNDPAEALRIATFLLYDADALPRSAEVWLQKAGAGGRDFLEGLAERVQQQSQQEFDRNNFAAGMKFMNEVIENWPKTAVAAEARRQRDTLYDRIQWQVRGRKWQRGPEGEFTADAKRVENSHLAEFFLSKDQEMFSFGGPRSNEEWVTYPNGEKVLLDTVKTIFRDQNGEVLGLIGISRDVTGRKMAENELKVAQERFETAFNASPMMIMILDDKSDKMIDVNLCCLEKTGYAKDEIVNRPLADLGFLSDPEIRRRFFIELEKNDNLEEFPVQLKKRTGEKISCLLAGRRVTFVEGPRLLIFLEDITFRQQAEEAMRRSIKMDAIGQVTGGIAHDFNNILGIIIGNLDFVKRFGDPDDLILKRVEAAAKASERAAMLTRQLLDFSGKQAKNHQPTDISRVIRGMDNLIAGSVTPEVKVVVDLAPDPWIVDIDRGDFENVLLNLVINARDAMPEGGKLQISTSNMILDEYYTLMNPGLTPGEYLLLAVRDDGVGIPPNVLDRIFEPFYTTKSQGKGTGLGMSMVYTFCKRSQGSARVYSEVGVGTTVHIYLPRIKDLAGEKTNLLRLGILPGLPGGKETILIVDDEEELLALAENVLRILGYKTLSATNGNEAVNLILNKSNTIDLLFTDVVMPGGINGFDLAEQALLLNPNLKILFTSGNIEKAVPKIGQFPSPPQVLMKPYRELDLAISIREALDELGKTEVIF